MKRALNRLVCKIVGHDWSLWRSAFRGRHDYKVCMRCHQKRYQKFSH